MAWMPLVLDEVARSKPDFKYLGLDIARPVIDANKVTFRDKANWQFDVKDMTADPLPRGFDLVYCRDALQHLECPLIVAALQNICLSGAKYLLVGSYASKENINISNGAYFPINLRLPPFSLPEPLAVLTEDTPGFVGTEHNKLQLLYNISQLQHLDFSAMKLRCGTVSIN